MRKGIITLFLLILLVSPLILATENNENKSEDGVEDVYQNSAGIPAFTFLFSRFPGFYLKMSWVEFAVYLMVSAFIFVGALEILSYPAFETSWVKALIAAGLLVITFLTGAITKLATLSFNFLDNFRLIAWIVVALIVGALLIKPIMAGIKKNKRLSKAEELGIRAGAALKVLKETSESSAKEVSKS